MRRIITALAVGGVLAAAVFGAAASLGGLLNTELSADDATVVSCEGQTPDGVLVDYQTGMNFLVSPLRTQVFGVNLSDFADGCLGKTATAMLTNGVAGFVSGSAVVFDPTPAGPPDDNRASIAFAGSIAASQVMTIHVTVES